MITPGRVTLVIALLSTLLLTGVLINGANADSDRENAALRALGAYEQAQAALARDVVSMRVGLLRNYDRLVTDVERLEQACSELRAAAEFLPETRSAIAVLISSADLQARLSEQLKSNNALLQNSLAFFTLAAPSAATGRSKEAIDALTAAMLRLTLDTSPESQEQVSLRLGAAEARGDDREAVLALLAHARVLQSQLPQADRALSTLLASDSVVTRRALRAIITKRRARAEARAEGFRVALFATSIVLVALLIYLGLRLSAHVAKLRRRARLEHIVAEVSASLIRASSTNVDATVAQALGRLAEELKADRAYFAGQGPYAPGHSWTRGAVGLEPDWPGRALAGLFPSRGALYVDAATQEKRAGRELLDAAGACSLALAWATNEEGFRLLLSFDSREGRLRLDESELEVVRLALDSMAGAVRRLAFERKRIELERRLQLARRLEAIGTFASGIAHNFNNILGGIGGYAEMAGAQAPPSSSAARQIGEIQRAVVRGRDLVHGILAFGRRRTEPTRRVDVAELMREAASILNAAYPPEARFAVATPPDDLGAVLGDESDLQQVLLNLGANAIRAMAGRGAVHLSANRSFLAHAREFATGTLAPGDYLCLAVEDSGRGVDPAVVHRIFDPFFTTRPDGHGLGLATAREIVRNHGGAMDVVSTRGEGSRFEIWLPQLQLAKLAAPTPRGGRTVLLLCATREDVLKCEDILAALACEPVGYSDEQEAVRALMSTPERFDAAICCHEQPSVTIAWATGLRRASSCLPLVLASHPSPQLNADAQALGRCLVAPWPLRSGWLARVFNHLPAL